MAPGRSVVLLYSMQLWALTLSWLLNHERIGWRAILGGVVGFGGIFLFINPMMIDWHDGQVLMGNGIGISAGLAWGLGPAFTGGAVGGPRSGRKLGGR